MNFLKTLILSLTLSTAAFAQDWSNDVYVHGEQYPGYVILENGDKMEGYILYTNRYDLQNQVQFFTEKGNRKTREKYKADELKEYQMADKTYHVIHYSGGLLKKPMRGNLLVKTDCITEYMWYDRADDYNLMRRGANESMDEYEKRLYPYETQVYLKKGDEYPVSLDLFALGFSKKMSEYVSDHSELSTKVANKEKGYKLLQLFDIMQEYNDWCNAQK